MGINKLVDAASAGNLKSVKDLIGFGYKVDKASVYLASLRGYWDIVKYLIENGGDADIALASAVVMPNHEMIKYLMDRGANPDSGLECLIREYNSPLLFKENIMHYVVAIDLFLKNGADWRKHKDTLPKILQQEVSSLDEIFGAINMIMVHNV